MQSPISLRPHPGESHLDDPRLRALVDWERHIYQRRPGIRDEVREAAYDKAVDALLKNDTLGRDTAGRPSSKVTFGLADRCLSWKRAEDIRDRLTPDGVPRSTPRAAQSLDAPLPSAEDDAAVVGSVVAAPEPPVEDVVHWRIKLDEVQRRAAAAGDLTCAVVTSYLVGGDCEDVAERHGVAANTVHQVKSRFVARNRDLGR